MDAWRKLLFYLFCSLIALFKLEINLALLVGRLSLILATCH